MKKHVIVEKIGLAIIAAVLSVLLILLSIQWMTEERVIPLPQLLFISMSYVVLIFFLLSVRALWQMVNLNSQNHLFSQQSLILIHTIRNYLLAVSISTIGFLPSFYIMADRSDAPGVMLVGFGVVGLSFALFLVSRFLEDAFKKALALQMQKNTPKDCGH